MSRASTSSSWGTVPRSSGGSTPVLRVRRTEPREPGGISTPLALLALAGALTAGCASSPEKKTYDPVPLGIAAGEAPAYDDGETTIYQLKRPVSLPIQRPTDQNREALSMTTVDPYGRLPWITTDDVKVQLSWTVSNLEDDDHQIEILIDPWNEFARYVPAVNVGEEEAVPDISGIDLPLLVHGKERKTGVFTFDDLDELATDLATVENILMLNPPMAAPADMPGAENTGTNGLINHTFEIHNRATDPDPLVHKYVPPVVAGLVGFDLGLRTYDGMSRGGMDGPPQIAIEVVVEIRDLAGNRVNVDEPLLLDGTYIEPEASISAPAGNVR
jgi:hypothetical protein